MNNRVMVDRLSFQFEEEVEANVGAVVENKFEPETNTVSCGARWDFA
jgi:hypothetical protein